VPGEIGGSHSESVNSHLMGCGTVGEELHAFQNITGALTTLKTASPMVVSLPEYSSQTVISL
jgi:hypothetical protein